MSIGASLSSGSFPPPGSGGSSPLPVNSPAPATTAAPPPAAAPASSSPSQVTSPALSTVLSGQISPENMAQMIHDLPSILSGLSPDEQDKLLQLLLTSDIMNTMFGDLDRPKTRDTFNSVVRSLFDNGLLSQVAADTVILTEEAQGALKDALQQKLVQTLVDVDRNLPQKNAANSTSTTTATPTQPAPTNTPEGEMVAGMTPTAEPEGESLAKLNIPVSQPGTPNQMPESVASLVANSVTGALQQFLSAGTNPATAANPQAAANLPQNQVATLLTSLIALGIATTPGGNLQLTIPTKTDAAGFQTQVSQLTQQLHQINQQFTQLGDLASSNKWNIGILNNFVSAPATLLTLLKSIQPGDTTTTNMMKTWVDNSDIINSAMLNKASDTFRDKFEFLKTILFSSFTAAPSSLIKEQQVRQQLFDQTLMQAPALLNVFKLKDMVGVFEEDIKRKHAALLYKFKRMLFNAAHEITVVANGKPTFEYNDVGIFHEQLEFLAQRLEVALPPAADELDFELMEVIATDMTHTFKYIQEGEPHKIKDILKRHPRTQLYFLAVDSPITVDFVFPRTESLGDPNDPVMLNRHFMRIMNVVKKFEKHSEFLKYQPKVLEAFIDEAKYDPTSDITKTSLNIVHKAVADCSQFIDLDSPD